MRRIGICVCVVSCWVVLGCGVGYKRAPVSGRVTDKGVPLAGATVQFIPESGTKGPGGIALTDQDGNYVLTGAKPNEVGIAPGEYKIRVSRLAGADGKTLAPGETESDHPGVRETIPPPWGGSRPSKQVDVPADGVTIDIEIHGKPQRPGAHPK